MFLTSSSEIDNLQGPDHRNLEGAFLKVGVCFFLNICKTHNVMKKSTIPCESTYRPVCEGGRWGHPRTLVQLRFSGHQTPPINEFRGWNENGCGLGGVINLSLTPT